jgi:ribosome-associated heat shock protein Hsp15
MTDKSVRIDKYLWAVRIFKTRSLATSACRMGRIMINDLAIKPSRDIEGEEVITVKKPPVTFRYKVKALTENRVSARLVSDYIEDMTPDSERIKGEINRSVSTGFRKKGTGRPTKKERRVIDRMKDDYSAG